MAQYYPLMALPHDQIGLLDDEQPVAGVVPFQGREPRYDTNPLTVAIPAGSRSRRSSSTWRRRPLPAARSRTRCATASRSRPTWALGRDGLPTDDPGEALDALPDAAARRDEGRLGAQGIGPRALGRHHVRRPLPRRLPWTSGGRTTRSATSSARGGVDAFAPARRVQALMDERLRDITSTRRRRPATTASTTPACPSGRPNRSDGPTVCALHPTVVEKLRALAAETGAFATTP